MMRGMMRQVSESLKYFSMVNNLTDIIMALLPEDGSSIGNASMLALLREQMPDLADADYAAAKDELVETGLVEKGKGRGGSIYLANVSDLSAQKIAEARLVRAISQTMSPATGEKGRKRRASQPTQVLPYRHNETRVNNPEVGMVRADTDSDGGKTVWDYDPHLDPTLNFDSTRAGVEMLIDKALTSDKPEQMRMALSELKRFQRPYLEWTGKAEKTSFEVDTVSLHVHERVDPTTILANVEKRQEGKPSSFDAGQGDLFHDPFENLPLRQALEFYSHEKGWSNRLVAGDSLLVMNSLLTRESMAGKVQMIYIDPPYGIKYGSNFQPFTNRRNVSDRNDQDLTQEPEMIRAFRDTWELGIHSYLTYLRDRMLLARELLTESGSIFVQIGDENVHRVRSLMDEVFGSENFISSISYRTSAPLSSKFIAGISDNILWYAKSRDSIKYRRLFAASTDADKSTYYKGINTNETSGDEEAEYQPYSNITLVAAGPNESAVYPIDHQEQEFSPTGGRGWKTTKERMARVGKAGRFCVPGKVLRLKVYWDDFPYKQYTNIWSDLGGARNKSYVVQTNLKVIERCLQMSTDPGDIVLDPTCGSGTTAFVAEKWGRRWITCDTSRVAITLAKQRLMTASFDYFSFRYPQEGLKGGFEYETAQHITLESMANNSDIDTIYEGEHPKVKAALTELNAILIADPPSPMKPTQGVRKGKAVNFTKGDTLYEWEVPTEWPNEDGEKWPEAVRKPFEAFHAARRKMQSRMDQSISDHADQETLYDKPHIDRSRHRVAGPFSVEAVPAPTVLSIDEGAPAADADASVARSGETSRQSLWRDELLKTGVRGKDGAMMEFAEFEILPGLKYIHASGSVAETGKRIVVSFGPEHAALEQRQVEMALSEAETLRPAPSFVLFCAFTFDPEAAKDIDEVKWSGVTMLRVQMNTDLLTEDLKRKRASNQSFWLMGQPEVELRKNEDGKWQVEVHGFDYFDPRTGEVTSGGKSQIAMWYLDTNYDQRSLMPHQVFFPMADGKAGWNRLRQTVRAELDEELMEQFHGTVSLPFEAEGNKRIAVKIVDDRGIESLKIMNLED